MRHVLVAVFAAFFVVSHVHAGPGSLKTLQFEGDWAAVPSELADFLKEFEQEPLDLRTFPELRPILDQIHEATSPILTKLGIVESTHLVLIDSMQVNAFSFELPSGDYVLGLNLGVLYSVKDYYDDELIGVIGHELQHRLSQISNYIASNPKELNDQLIEILLGRVAENEVDVKSTVEVLHEMGRNPHGLRNFIGRLAESRRNRMDFGDSSHTSSGSRFQSMDGALTALSRVKGDKVKRNVPEEFTREITGPIQVVMDGQHFIDTQNRRIQEFLDIRSQPLHPFFEAVRDTQANAALIPRREWDRSEDPSQYKVQFELRRQTLFKLTTGFLSEKQRWERVIDLHIALGAAYDKAEREVLGENFVPASPAQAVALLRLKERGGTYIMQLDLRHSLADSYLSQINRAKGIIAKQKKILETSASEEDKRFARSRMQAAETSLAKNQQLLAAIYDFYENPAQAKADHEWWFRYENERVLVRLLDANPIARLGPYDQRWVSNYTAAYDRFAPQLGESFQALNAASAPYRIHNPSQRLAQLADYRKAVAGEWETKLNPAQGVAEQESVFAKFFMEAFATLEDLRSPIERMPEAKHETAAFLTEFSERAPSLWALQFTMTKIRKRQCNSFCNETFLIQEVEDEGKRQDFDGSLGLMVPTDVVREGFSADLVARYFEVVRRLTLRALEERVPVHSVAEYVGKLAYEWHREGLLSDQTVLTFFNGELHGIIPALMGAIQKQIFQAAGVTVSEKEVLSFLVVHHPTLFPLIQKMFRVTPAEVLETYLTIPAKPLLSAEVSPPIHAFELSEILFGGDASPQLYGFFESRAKHLNWELLRETGSTYSYGANRLAFLRDLFKWSSANPTASGLKNQVEQAIAKWASQGRPGQREKRNGYPSEDTNEREYQGKAHEFYASSSNWGVTERLAETYAEILRTKFNGLVRDYDHLPNTVKYQSAFRALLEPLNDTLKYGLFVRDAHRGSYFDDRFYLNFLAEKPEEFIDASIGLAKATLQIKKKYPDFQVEKVLPVYGKRLTVVLQDRMITDRLPPETLVDAFVFIDFDGMQGMSPDDLLRQVWARTNQRPDLRERLRDPQLVGKLRDQSEIKNLATWQLDQRFFLNETARRLRNREAALPEYGKVRRVIRTILTEIERQFSKSPSRGKDAALDYVMEQLLTNHAETKLLSKHKIGKDNWFKSPGLAHLDLPDILSQVIESQADRLDLVRYLIGTKTTPPRLVERIREKGGDFNRRDAVRLFDVFKQRFEKLDALSQNLALQPFLSDRKGILSSPDTFAELTDLMLGAWTDQPIARRLLESYLRAVNTTSQRGYVIGHILSSMVGRNGKRASFAQVLEAMGPLGIKAGQFLRASGLLNAELSAELDHFFENAIKVQREEVHAQIHELLKPAILPFVRVREVVGLGSIAYGVLLDITDPQTGVVDTAVQLIKRKGVEGKISNENDHWMAVIADLAQDPDPEIRRAVDIFEEVRRHSMDTLAPGGPEFDFEFQRELFERVESVYGSNQAIPTRAVKPLLKLQKWVRDDRQKDTSFYEYIKHSRFKDLAPEQRRENVRSILPVEFGAIFSGRFCSDGHPGNWPYDEEKNELVRLDTAQFREFTSTENLPDDDVIAMKEVFTSLLWPGANMHCVRTLEKHFDRVFDTNGRQIELNQVLRKLVYSAGFRSRTMPHDRIFYLRDLLQSHLVAEGNPDSKVTFQPTARSMLSGLARVAMLREEVSELEYFTPLADTLGISLTEFVLYRNALATREKIQNVLFKIPQTMAQCAARLLRGRKD